MLGVYLIAVVLHSLGVLYTRFSGAPPPLFRGGVESEEEAEAPSSGHSPAAALGGRDPAAAASPTAVDEAELAESWLDRWTEPTPEMEPPLDNGLGLLGSTRLQKA